MMKKMSKSAHERMEEEMKEKSKPNKENKMGMKKPMMKKGKRGC